MRPDRVAGHHDFVAGREDADARAAMGKKPGSVHRRQQADVARGEPPTRSQQDLAFGEIEPLAPDVTAARRTFQHPDPVAVALRVLLDDDRVGARRQRSPGEDAGRFARADMPAEAGSSATMCNSTGIAARSSARTAYPSIAETAKGGCVLRAATSSARTRPSPSTSEICSGGSVISGSSRRASASSTEITALPPNPPTGHPIYVKAANR